MTVSDWARNLPLHAIIVHWGDPTRTLELSSRLAQFALIESITVVANDLSAPADGLDPVVDWIIPPRNLGFAGGFDYAARKVGLESAFLLLNSDLRFSEECVAVCLDALADESTGIVAPVTVNDSGFQAGVGTVSSILCRGRMREPQSPEPVDAEWVTGAMMLIKGECYAAAPFDLSYFLYWEDADLCFRARNAGWRVVVASDARAWHQGGATVPSLGAYYYSVRNRLWFARRWKSRPRFLALCVATCALVPRMAISDLVKRRSLRPTYAIMRGVLAGVRRPPTGKSVPRDEPRAASWILWK